MAITLPKDVVARLTPSLKRFFAEHLDQDLSEMKTAIVLDYFVKEIGPLVYNLAIKDAQGYFAERLGDLEAACYEKEFTYSAEKPMRNKR